MHALGEDVEPLPQQQPLAAAGPGAESLRDGAVVEDAFGFVSDPAVARLRRCFLRSEMSCFALGYELERWHEGGVGGKQDRG